MIGNTGFNNQDRYQENEDENYIIQQYDKYSAVSSGSDYGINNRQVEFEYYKDPSNEQAYIITRFLSSQTEKIEDERLIILLEKRDKSLRAESFTSEPYMQRTSNSYTTPVTRYETVTDPGGVDVVHKPDGTVEHVHRPASTKTVTKQEQQQNQYTSTEKVVFNTGEYPLDERDIKIILRYKLYDYGVLIGNDTLFIYPSESQIERLQSFLVD